jgi:hypothetical protein
MKFEHTHVVGQRSIILVFIILLLQYIIRVRSLQTVIFSVGPIATLAVRKQKTYH